MNPLNSDNPNEKDAWSGAPEALHKLGILGWIEEAHIMDNGTGGGTAIRFTHIGKEKLKPFAEVWQRFGGLKGDVALALFCIAIQSQEPESPKGGSGIRDNMA